MKSLHFSFLGLLLISFILSYVSSQQLPFIVPDYDLAGLVDQDPIQLDDDPFDNDDLSIHNEPEIPPPIWSLCGDLSKHLLIPYPSLASLPFFRNLTNACACVQR